MVCAARRNGGGADQTRTRGVDKASREYVLSLCFLSPCVCLPLCLDVSVCVVFSSRFVCVAVKIDTFYNQISKMEPCHERTALSFNISFCFKLAHELLTEVRTCHVATPPFSFSPTWTVLIASYLISGLHACTQVASRIFASKREHDVIAVGEHQTSIQEQFPFVIPCHSFSLASSIYMHHATLHHA